MLTSLEIKNFRCFHHTKTKGFSKINLFGGKNNAGKTVLLEALLLLNEPINKNIGLLLQFRRLDVEFIKKIPTRAWDNFFYQQKKENVEIVISTKNEKNESQKVTLHCNESTEHFTSLAQNTDENDEDLQHFIRNISKRETVKSVLHINAFKEDEKVSTNTFVASNQNVMGNGQHYIFTQTHFIPASLKRSNDALAEEFDIAKLEGYTSILLKAFQLIDNTIIAADTFSIGEPTINLSREGEKPIPLTFFGDAMNKIADIILRIINNKNSILLIDEIENGIHHTNQEKFWKFLFDLCDTFNVQIFANTHSAEMLNAFKNVILQHNLEKEGRYFEMYQHSKSKEIVVQKIPITAVEEKLITKQALRGE